MTALTWNCEGIKNSIYTLKEILTRDSTDLVFLSEPQIFQPDIATTMGLVDSTHSYYLNSDDLHDCELALKKSKSLGGTLVMWKKCLDPFVTIHPVNTPAFTPLILQPPGYQLSIHIALYLPTSGKEQEFATELTNLRTCLDELSVLYPSALVFIRGDGNVNQKNAN